MPAVRICIIGGGSAYMTSMFGSIARYAKAGDLAGSSVVLNDINEPAMRRMCDWAAAGAKNDRLDLKFSCEKSLKKALAGADFVLSCIRPGGLDMRYLDETIPVKHRELGNETVGVGGVFMALRTIPAVVEIAEAVGKACPNAWLINYTNPTNMVVDATIRAGHRKTLGLCDGIWGAKWLGAKLLKIPVSRAHEIDAWPAGVNHHTWAMRLEHKGRDLYKDMDRLIAEADLTPAAGYETIDENQALNQIEVDACRLYQYYGVLPGTAYYARYYYNLRDLLENHYFKPGHEFRSQWIKRTNEEKYKVLDAQMKSGRATLAAHDHEDAAHGDQAIGALQAIACDRKFLESAIVANSGRALPNLPEDAIVEIGCRMGKDGPKAEKTPALPLSLEGMVRDAWIFAKLSVDAAISGDRKLVLQAAMAHPAHRDLNVTEKIIAELFEAQKQWLPRFFKK
jgi:6-phospho-beta-glucosidase